MPCRPIAASTAKLAASSETLSGTRAHRLCGTATISANGRIVPLTPGLAVTADIRTGSRSIISWLLSPILTTVKQAAREQ